VTPEEISSRKAESDKRDRLEWLLGVQGDHIWFHWVNQKYEEVVGLGSADMEGKDPIEIYGPETGNAVLGRYRQCVRQWGQYSYREELKILGKVDWWDTTLSPIIKDRGTRVAGIFGYCEKATEKVSIEVELRKALIHKELVLYYQPIVHVQTLELQGFESLIRWPATRMGPSDFMPIAKEQGLMGEINQLVVAAVVKQAALCRNPKIFYAMNFSSFSGVSDLIERTAKAHGVALAKLGAEIVETATLDEATLKQIEKLEALGVIIELDDYGTVQNNLETLYLLLEHVKLSAIKVDMKFIKGIADSLKAQIFFEAILSLNNRLRDGLGYHIRVICEGVGDDEQGARDYEYLKQFDVLAQGYRFGRPVPLDDVAGPLPKQNPGG
jgi:PAS domain S-box-containing protein